MSAINYQSLSRPVDFRSIRAAITPREFGRLVSRVIISSVILAVCITVWLNGISTDLMNVVVAISAFYFVVCVMRLGLTFFKARRKIRAGWFAAENSLELLTDVKQPRYRGSLFNQGYDRLIENAYRFVTSVGDVEIGRYNYTGKRDRNGFLHVLCYARIDLPRHLPHMLLDSKKNNLLRYWSAAAADMTKDQVLHLEGNFDNYFTLYAPKEYERDALYVFTPDVMAALIDTVPYADVELVDGHLMIYATKMKNVTSEKNVAALLHIAEVIGKRVGHQADYYADERVSDRATNTIAPKGKRLRTRDVFTTVAMIFFATAFFVMQLVYAPQTLLILPGIPLAILLTIHFGSKIVLYMRRPK
ncbi:MAG: hypothetical protein WBB39_02715 [Candidatus Saccharimonadales bacterium]